MRRYFFTGRYREVAALPLLRGDILGEVMRRKSKWIGWISSAKWYHIHRCAGGNGCLRPYPVNGQDPKISSARSASLRNGAWRTATFRKSSLAVLPRRFSFP
jgi:hypothetical protein